MKSAAFSLCFLSVASLLPCEINSFSFGISSSNRPSSIVLRMTSSSSNGDQYGRRALFGKASDFAAEIAVLSTVTASFSSASIANAYQEYLTEPTDDFKESERQRMEFKKVQIELKKQFLEVLDRLSTKSKTEDELRTDLQQLRALTIKTGGLPLGIQKQDMYKTIRTVKARGFWPTSVEIAYGELIREVSFQQSPNKEKDSMSPI